MQHAVLTDESYEILALKMLEVRMAQVLCLAVRPEIEEDDREGRLSTHQASTIIHRILHLGDGLTLQDKAFGALSRMLMDFHAEVPTCQRLSSILALRQTSPRQMEMDAIVWLRATLPETWEHELTRIDATVIRDNFVYGYGFFREMVDAMDLRKHRT